MSQLAASKPRPGDVPSLLSAFLFISFLVGCAGPPKNPTWSNATGAEQYERLMWQAIQNRDWTNFEHRLAPAFVGVGPGGKAFDRANWVEHWKQAGITGYSLGEVAVQPGGPDLIITYVITFAGDNYANVIPSNRMRVVSVWQQVRSRLVQTTCSMTPLEQE